MDQHLPHLNNHIFFRRSQNACKTARSWIIHMRTTAFNVFTICGPVSSELCRFANMLTMSASFWVNEGLVWNPVDTYTSMHKQDFIWSTKGVLWFIASIEAFIIQSYIYDYTRCQDILPWWQVDLSPKIMCERSFSRWRKHKYIQKYTLSLFVFESSLTILF